LKALAEHDIAKGLVMSDARSTTAHAVVELRTLSRPVEMVAVNRRSRNRRRSFNPRNVAPKNVDLRTTALVAIEGLVWVQAV